MDEETMREGELSEEQLQEISGGCPACGRDRGIIANAKRRRDDYSELAQQAPDPERARFYTQRVDRQSDLIRTARERIVGRGHEHLLDHPLLPDLNLPPPGEGGGAGG